MKTTRFLGALLAPVLLTAAPGAHAEEAAPGPKLPPPAIAETLTLETAAVAVLDSKMAYLHQGDGEVVLFVHGNPTSSYLWRNIMPYIPENKRAVAVDLIGMGRSGKPDIDYTFADHYRYFEAFVDTLGAETITLVGHDWGAALSWEYARRNPARVARLAFMEGVLPPTFPMAGFEAMGPDFGPLFQGLKDPVQGHEMVIKNNMFVEQLLPNLINRPLGDEAMTAYRAPYLEEAHRKPILQWPRELPIAGEPAATQAALEGIAGFMRETEMPVLLLYADPGAIVPPQAVPWYLAAIKNLETNYIGQGFHYIQEDQPDAIGRELADWLRRTDTKTGF